MATALADIEPDYAGLRSSLVNASVVSTNEDFVSELGETLWGQIDDVDTDWVPWRDVARRRLARTSASTFQRRATLGLVMAWLGGFPLDDAAQLLGTSTVRLTAWLRGTESIPRSRDKRLEQVATVVRVLHRVIEPSATHRWFIATIQDLGGSTPLDSFRRNHADDVLRVVESYLDPAFS